MELGLVERVLAANPLSVALLLLGGTLLMLWRLLPLLERRRVAAGLGLEQAMVKRWNDSATRSHSHSSLITAATLRAEQAGAAAASAKAHVERLEAEFRAHTATSNQALERFARVETKVEGLEAGLERVERGQEQLEHKVDLVLLRLPR